MRSSISFILNGQLTGIEFSGNGEPGPTTTVLNYLRQLPGHKGVKEGCAEGDCGACTVVLGELTGDGRVRYRAVDSCLLFLPMIHGKHLVTVEHLCAEDGTLHPVQEAMVETDGSQCGYCTPGFIMSMYALYNSCDQPSRAEIDDALAGNLCRCTGYRPIVEAAALACGRRMSGGSPDGEERTARLLASIPRESLHLRRAEQQYFRPVSLGEAVTLKHRYPDGTVLCGATDVALRVTKNHEVLATVIDCSAVEELQRCDDDGVSLVVGAGIVLTELMPRIRQEFPALHEMLALFGSQQIRNLATLGGNLGTASPIGDTLPVLMACGARVVLESLNGKRELPLREFFTGYRRTLRKPDELITGVMLPKTAGGSVVKSYKVSKRRDLDIATVSAGMERTLDENGAVVSVILAYGGMAERPARAAGAEQFLLGKAWERPVIEEAMGLIDHDFSPIDDARGGAAMRRIAARNLLLKFWSETQR
jgi:xanthine dehydrogenase small subunit